MITWTIIIGVIMVAMSIGNLLGGHLADHHDPAKRLYQLILAAALWIAMIPLAASIWWQRLLLVRLLCFLVMLFWWAVSVHA